MSDANEKELLIIVSKLKKYIKDQAGMNTSGAVAEVLSEKVRDLCNEAINHAKEEGRKTVMDRDFTTSMAA
jgi:histone H3/H4